MQYDAQSEVFASKSPFLSPSSSRKSPLRQSINNRRSNSSLHASNLAHVVDDDAATGRHSLAHELAVALMPEPTMGSKLLAEEFGIEYDEGAEGIDEEVHSSDDLQVVINGTHAPSFADELDSTALSLPTNDDVLPPEISHTPPELDHVFSNPSLSKGYKEQRVQQDAMEVLAHDLESTDKFLIHLRTLDVDPGSSGAQQPALEQIASDVIRRINETARDREGQVRELLGYEREFRKIAGEVGGSEVLGHLDELTHIDDLLDDKSPHATQPESRPILDIVEEESPSIRHRSYSHDWETDPDRLQDDDFDDEPVASPMKDSFPPPPPLNGHATPAKTIPQLAHLRSFTTSLVTSLVTISEQAQVNGAATTEAGRKIRALKNKLGGWRTDWDSAERSRVRIDRWEAGIVEGENESNNTPLTPTRSPTMKRVDGRKVVAEHLHAFEIALADAATRTQAIIAS